VRAAPGGDGAACVGAVPARARAAGVRGGEVCVDSVRADSVRAEVAGAEGAWKSAFVARRAVGAGRSVAGVWEDQRAPASRRSERSAFSTRTLPDATSTVVQDPAAFAPVVTEKRVPVTSSRASSVSITTRAWRAGST